MGEGKKKFVTEVNCNSLSTENSKRGGIEVDICDLSLLEEDGTPLRPIFCVKNIDKIREIEEREDCFILDFDPDEISKLSVSPNTANVDLSVIAQKGQVACRDYPHSRHICVKYPFEKTPHESYCKLCYCFVCDVAAPCKKWSGTSGHCHAIDNESWESQRKLMRERKLFQTTGCNIVML
ncbi:hypothetical protein M9H77_26293 [Catharanthus roseus]|uniref:Uncharacterized protein n=1 Tax=Catharanthus roseus TaxID=4058 RepID=A0ACC0AB39_CATRO|nr:hypothetical protein M9H77_26293 [Catharanthus roseus]